MNADFTNTLSEFLTKFNLQVEEMTQNQLAELLRQMIASGDIVRFVGPFASDVKEDPKTVTLSHSQSFHYMPYRDSERLKKQVKERDELLIDCMMFMSEIGRGVHGGSSGDPHIIRAQDMHDKVFALLKGGASEGN